MICLETRKGGFLASIVCLIFRGSKARLMGGRRSPSTFGQRYIHLGIPKVLKKTQLVCFFLRTHNEFVKQLMTLDFRRGKMGEMDCGQWQADPCQIYAKCPKFDQIIAEFGKVAGTWRYVIWSDHVGTSVFRKSHVFMLKKWLSFNLKPEFQLNFWEGNSPQSYTIDIKT